MKGEYSIARQFSQLEGTHLSAVCAPPRCCVPWPADAVRLSSSIVVGKVEVYRPIFKWALTQVLEGLMSECVSRCVRW